MVKFFPLAVSLLGLSSPYGVESFAPKAHVGASSSLKMVSFC
jgi:hypothetical protein